MEIAKSLFNVRDHEGYVGKEDHNVNTYIFINVLSIYLQFISFLLNKRYK